MLHELKKLPQSQVELVITVTPSDYEKSLQKAAQRITERKAVRGFRPGKVPYEIIKKELGEMAILQEALEAIVQESFFQAVRDEKLNTIGMPQINIEKLAPGNDVVYKAMVALLPKVQLADLSKIKVEKKIKPITNEQIDEVISNLRKLQAKEIIKNSLAEAADIVLIDMEMFIDNVPVEGGQTKNYRVYLSEDHYIPGFNKELLGLKKDDEKNFKIDFPKTHYQKHLAGKKVDVSVKIRDVFERQLPEFNDEFAKTLGQESVTKLRELLALNLSKEANQRAEEQVEIAIFDALLEKSTLEDIPEVLIDAERKKMYYELTRDLDRRGISIEQYLNDIKKKEEDLFNDFKIQAEKRAKAALISRQVAIEQNITVADSEIDIEIKTMEETYEDNKDYLENLKKPEILDTIRNVLQNKKVIKWLKEQILDPAKA